jgi:hypothetical protein
LAPLAVTPGDDGGGDEDGGGHVGALRVAHLRQLRQGFSRGLEQPGRPQRRGAAQAEVPRGVVGAGLDDAVFPQGGRGDGSISSPGPAAAAAVPEAASPHVARQRPAAPPDGHEACGARGTRCVEARERPQRQAARDHQRERREPGLPAAFAAFAFAFAAAVFLEQPSRGVGDDGAPRDVIVELPGELRDGGRSGLAQVAR